VTERYGSDAEGRDIDMSSENVLEELPEGVAAGAGLDSGADVEQSREGDAWGAAAVGDPADEAVDHVEETAGEVEDAEGEEPAPPSSEPAPESAELPVEDGPLALVDQEPHVPHQHAEGDLEIPDGYAVLEGSPEGGRRAVGIVAARFNGQVTTQLLARALEELQAVGVPPDAITIMAVPGAFELPLAATALAKTRRFACIVALGCVIRGDTPHFDYVASEAASGLQLAALETGVPVAFGVLTLDRIEQAEPRIEKGAEAVRTALEMADAFARLRAAASR
jgi:6,7-dimethyl-8-ribityllumazine synthase